MEQLTPLLEKLADKLGTTTEYLWAVLIKQAVISGITDLILYVLLIVAIIVWIKCFNYYNKNYKEIYNDDKEFLYAFGLGTYATGLFILLALAISQVSITLAAFFNPEYWALQEILKHL